MCFWGLFVKGASPGLAHVFAKAGRVVNAIAQTAFVQSQGTTHVYFECETTIAICFQSTLIGFKKNYFTRLF